MDRRAIIVVAILVGACSSNDPPKDAGGDATQANDSAAADSAAADSAVDVVADVGPSKKGIGEFCATNADCESGVCTTTFNAPAKNYCSKNCINDASCMMGDGHGWACATPGAGPPNQCVRTCANTSADCGTGGTCNNNAVKPGVGVCEYL